MKIVFSAIGSGFANNGGSKTIISCANVLHGMGHDVSLASLVWNYSWSMIKAKKIHHLPWDVDVIIATANATVEPLLRHRTQAKKIWYVRGWETWSISHKEMIRLCSSIDCIANSTWLSEQISKSCNKPCPVIYPGLDTDIFFPVPRSDNGITIGGLYCNRPLKRMPLWLKVAKAAQDKYGVKIRLFGDGPKPNLDISFEYYQQPNPAQHRQFYNDCDIWIFTSSNEGLHIPPMEAGLCNCALVGPEIGGVKDYAIHGTTALTHGDLGSNVYKLIADETLRHTLSTNLRNLLLSKIGTREHNMTKLIKLLEGSCP